MRRTLFAGVPALLMLIAPSSAHAQEEAAFVWTNATELSYVATGGNAASSTLGLKLNLTGSGGPNALKFEVGGIRAESDFTSRSAIGTVQSFRVDETTRSETTAESYFARGRYDRTMGEVFTFGGAGWERNTFAGVQNRYSLVAGLGRSWTESENGRFKTDLGATYTIQKDVSPVPGGDDAFGGLRFTLDAMRKLSETAELSSLLVVDENLEETGDVRADWLTSLSVSISERLALKTSLQLLFDNEPAFLSVPLFSSPGVATGTDVLTPGNEVDRVVTVTLVIKL